MNLPLSSPSKIEVENGEDIKRQFAKMEDRFEFLTGLVEKSMKVLEEKAKESGIASNQIGELPEIKAIEEKFDRVRIILKKINSRIKVLEVSAKGTGAPFDSSHLEKRLEKIEVQLKETINELNSLKEKGGNGLPPRPVSVSKPGARPGSSGEQRKQELSAPQQLYENLKGNILDSGKPLDQRKKAMMQIAISPTKELAQKTKDGKIIQKIIDELDDAGNVLDVHLSLGLLYVVLVPLPVGNLPSSWLPHSE